MPVITEDRKKDLLIASIDELIHEKPCQQISVSDICMRAKTSKSTFYKYFASKEDAFSHLYVYVTPRVMRVMPAILVADAPVMQKYWSITHFFPKRSVELGYEAVSYICQCGFAAQEHPFFKGKDDFQPISDALLRKAQELKEVRTDLSPGQMHDLLQRMLAGMTMEWSSRKGEYDLVHELFDAMMAMFGAKPAFGYLDILGEALG